VIVGFEGLCRRPNYSVDRLASELHPGDRALGHCLCTGIIGHQGAGEAGCMIGSVRREPILWRNPDRGDASAYAVESGLRRIRADADNNNTARTSGAGGQARPPANGAGCASQRTRAISTVPSMWIECGAGAALILGTGGGRLLQKVLRYKI
jgi:hypothetical protein